MREKNFQRGIASHIHTHWFTDVQKTPSRAEKFCAWCLSRNGKAHVEYTCYEDSLGIDAGERASKEDIQFSLTYWVFFCHWLWTEGSLSAMINSFKLLTVKQEGKKILLW